MILTTTHTVDGAPIQEYLGIVTGEAILGVNIFRDIFAGIRDIVGGRSAAYERELHTARELALRGLEEEALLKGANVVVGVDLDYEVVGAKGSMLMVSASGTAVVIQVAPHEYAGTGGEDAIEGVGRKHVKGIQVGERLRILERDIPLYEQPGWLVARHSPPGPRGRRDGSK